MGDKIRKEQEELKNQLKTFMKEHEALRAKMTKKLDRSFAPTYDDVQSVNISRDGLLAHKINNKSNSEQCFSYKKNKQTNNALPSFFFIFFCSCIIVVFTLFSFFVVVLHL